MRSATSSVWREYACNPAVLIGHAGKGKGPPRILSHAATHHRHEAALEAAQLARLRLAERFSNRRPRIVLHDPRAGRSREPRAANGGIGVVEEEAALRPPDQIQAFGRSEHHPQHKAERGWPPLALAERITAVVLAADEARRWAVVIQNIADAPPRPVECPLYARRAAIDTTAGAAKK